MLLDRIGMQPYASRLFVWGEPQLLLARGFRLSVDTDEEVLQVQGKA